MEHTKGEWRLDKLSSFRYILYPQGKDNSYTIAEINTGVSSHTKILPNEGEANARLIASAPDTTEALRDLISFLINNGFTTDQGVVPHINKGTKALKKAGVNI